MKLGIVNAAGMQSKVGEQLASWLLGTQLEAVGFSGVDTLSFELFLTSDVDAGILIVDVQQTSVSLPPVKKLLRPVLPIVLLDSHMCVAPSLPVLSPFHVYVDFIPTLISLPLQFAGAKLSKNQALKQRLQTAFHLLAQIAQTKAVCMD